MLCVCMLSGQLQFFDLRLQPLQILSEAAGAPPLPAVPLSSHLDYRARPLLMEWCRAGATSGQPSPSADHLAVVFDRGPLAIVRLERPVLGTGENEEAKLGVLQLLRQHLNTAAACLLRCGADGRPASVTTADAVTMMRKEHDHALELLRALPPVMKQVQARGLVLVVERLLSLARRPELVKAGKQGWTELGAVLQEWWEPLFSRADAPFHKEMLALYVRYYFDVLRCVVYARLLRWRPSLRLCRVACLDGCESMITTQHG